MARLWRLVLLLVLVAIAAAKAEQQVLDNPIEDNVAPGPMEGSMPVDGEIQLPDGKEDIRVPDQRVCADREMTDCYPKIFKPTDKFQEVREGQDLPKGLHVRVNLETGKREAKIYNPKEAENEAPAVVAIGEVYDTPKEELAADTSDWYSNQAFDRVPPPKPHEKEKLEGFRQILFSEKPSDERIEEALDGIEELSHDRSLGVSIATDSYLLHNFVHVLRDSKNAELRRKAALVIGSSLQNNPTAWNATRSMVSVGETERWPMIRLLTERLREEMDVKVEASIVFALKHTISRSRSARMYFINDMEGYVAMGGCLAPYLTKEYGELERIPPSYQEVDEEPTSSTEAPATDSPSPRIRRDRKEGYVPQETSHTAEQREQIASLDNLSSKIAVLVRDLIAMNRQFAPVPKHETAAKREVRLLREAEERDENYAALKEWNTVLNFVLDKTKGDPMSAAVWTMADISNELNYCRQHYKECWPGHDN